MAIASQTLTNVAFERALHGTSNEIWQDGELVREVRTPSDQMLMFLLEHFDQQRYGVLSGLLPVQIDDPRKTAKVNLTGYMNMLEDEGDAGQNATPLPGSRPRRMPSIRSL
jgi:hypothetical protein